MKRDIFLEENRSKFSNNAESRLNVGLSAKTRLLPESSIESNFSLLEQYNAERDDCEKFRMIFAVNPICSNILFNMKSEIIRNEGSDMPLVLTDVFGIPYSLLKNVSGFTIQNTRNVTRLQAIRDTEYSHPSNGGFVYHCGLDIFNNHMLRSKEFVHINKMAGTDSNVSSVYNTLSDYLRNSNGEVIKTIHSISGQTASDTHVYRLDSVLSFKNAYNEKLKEKDGWWGFINPGTMDIPNSDSKDVLINRMMANNKPCEFYDMYPDRSLYSFIPKYNKFRHRIEKNWDYCITYPYAIDKELVKTICGAENGAIAARIKLKTNTYGLQMIQCHTYFKHTLKENDSVAIYVRNEEGELIREIARVISLGDDNGDNKKWYFSIRKTDLNDEQIPKDGKLFYKKIAGGCECEYYFRKYRKIRNIDGSELRSDVNKLAYSENIYGDRVGQIVFTDDIDITGLKDHLGRPVSEVYLTIIKRNAGYKEWSRGNFGDKNVEFSHCFGEVTSGLDFGRGNYEISDYNIRGLHNVRNLTGGTLDVVDSVIKKTPLALEREITINEDEFYGDLVEFDKYFYVETEISPVLHRFNTVQRENTTLDGSIRYDDIITDDYDMKPNGEPEGFRTEEKNLAKYLESGTEHSILGNLSPEGYFYNPHTKIKVREFSETTMSARGKYINFAKGKAVYYKNGIKDTMYDGVECTEVEILAPTNYGFLMHDFMAIYDSEMGRVSWGEVTGLTGNVVRMMVSGNLADSVMSEDITSIFLPSEGKKRFYVYFMKESVPTYATFVPSTATFVWKAVIPPSSMGRQMELYDTTFTNGRFYIEKNINFFLRRQDPEGLNGLLYARDAKYVNPMEYFRVDSKPIDLSQALYFYNNLDNVCY